MDPILTLSATALSAEIAAGRISARRLMAATLARIAEVNGALNAIVSLRDEAALMDAAARADAGPRQGWLHGIPMAIKDLAQTAGIRSTLGSPLLADHVPATDDAMVQRLRAAGAIVIGKTNVPEFGLGSHTTNPVFGVTRCPWDLSRSAGGSSGGAGAALAARMLALADGSDMMGSLRNPAAWNNVYGMRPTWGLVPAQPGGDTFLHPLATNGPMARCPADLAALLCTMAGPDPRVLFARPAEDWAAWLARPPGRIRLGWLGDWGGAWPVEPGILALIETALGALPAEVRPLDPPFDAAELWDSWTTLRSFAVAGRLGAFYDDPARRARLKPAALWEIERGRALTPQAIQRASDIRSAWYARAAELFADHDALVLPSAQMWPFDAEIDWPRAINGQPMDTYHRWMEVVIPASLIGLPALACPAGFGAEGLPMGFQLIGPAGGDGRLLQIAQAWHQVRPWADRLPPR